MRPVSTIVDVLRELHLHELSLTHDTILVGGLRGAFLIADLRNLPAATLVEAHLRRRQLLLFKLLFLEQLHAGARRSLPIEEVTLDHRTEACWAVIHPLLQRALQLLIEVGAI